MSFWEIDEDGENDAWCPHCRDYRPVNDTGVCGRCSRSVEEEPDDDEGLAF